MKLLKNFKKVNNGITLIALVITIIVLLILAGVSIATLTGENGIITQANNAKNKTQLETDRELLSLAKTEAIKIGGKIDLEKLDNNLPKGFSKVEEGTNYRIYRSSAGNSFIVYEDGKLQSTVTLADLESKYKFVYYSTFSEAIADSNNNTKENGVLTKENAVAGIYTNENGKTVVILLQDTEQSSALNITRDTIINLGGKTLSLTTAGTYLNFNENTNATIDGTMEGSTIKVEEISTDQTYVMIRAAGASLEINGGNYLISGYFKNAMPIRIDTGTTSFNNCKFAFDVEIGNQIVTIGYNANAGESIIENCEIDVKGKNATAMAGVFRSKSNNITIENSKLKLSSNTATILGMQANSNTTGQIEVLNSSIDTKSDNKAVGIVVGSGTDITVSSTRVSTQAVLRAEGMIFNSNSNAIVNDCILNVSSDSELAFGIICNAGNNLTLSNTKIFADATDGDAPSNKCAIGLWNAGTATVNSSNITGTHSAIQTNLDSKTYVYGGTYSSCSHGGIYFSQGENGEAYVENATLKCIKYSGDYPSTPPGLNYMYGAFYIGSNSNSSVYMDGCTITGGNNAFVLRSTDGETGNKLYISNSTIGNNFVRVDENQYLYVGTGTNITQSNINSKGEVEFTEQSYKKQ